MKNSRFGKILKSYSLITLGVILLTAGVYFFKFPNHFTTGGVSALSIIFGYLTDSVSPGAFVLIINAALLVLGFIILGGSFGIKTVYASSLFSLGTLLLENVVPLSEPMTDQPLLELFFSVMLPAVGSALMFNEGASSGGTDITAMILRKYTDMDIGKALLVCDGLIAASSFFVFDVKTGLFSLFGLILKAFVVDGVLENFNICKFFVIVTEHYEPVCKFITEQLHHGATVSDARGYFTNHQKKLVLVACRRSEAIALRHMIKETDPDAFMFITNTSEIIGKGFRS